MLKFLTAMKSLHKQEIPHYNSIYATLMAHGSYVTRTMHLKKKIEVLSLEPKGHFHYFQKSNNIPQIYNELTSI